MKNLKRVLGIMFFAILAILTGCITFDNGAGPSITWTQDIDTVKVGNETVVTFEFKIEPDLLAGNSIETFYIEYDTLILVEENYTDSAKTQYYTFKYTVPSDTEVGEISFTVSAIDNNGSTSVEMATIVVAEDGGGGPVVVELLTKSGTLGYNSTNLDNKMMLVCDDNGTITNAYSTAADLAFVWQNGYGYSICSPDANWIKSLFNYNSVTYDNNSKHNTKIMKFTGDYANLTETYVDGLTIISNTVNEGGNGVQYLSNGDMIAFETQSGQKGVLKIISNAKTTKNMTFEIKYQKPNSSVK